MAQNVNDDSVQYTPIPLPKEKKLKTHERSSVSKEDRKFSYFLYLQSGVLIGCRDCGDASGVSSTTSAVNGIAIGKKFRAGAGLGFDSYTGWQTVPAFLSISYDLFGNKKRNAFFVQLNYGLSKAWLKESFRGFNFKKAEGGHMFAPELGYRIKYHDLNVSFAAGVKFQRAFSYYAYPTWNWIGGEYQPGTNNTKIKQDMTRLMLTMAIGF